MKNILLLVSTMFIVGSLFPQITEKTAKVTESEINRYCPSLCKQQNVSWTGLTEQGVETFQDGDRISNTYCICNGKNVPLITPTQAVVKTQGEAKSTTGVTADDIYKKYCPSLCKQQNALWGHLTEIIPEAPFKNGDETSTTYCMCFGKNVPLITQQPTE